MGLVHEGSAVETNRRVSERTRIVDQSLKNRPSDSLPASRRPHIHALDLRFIAGQPSQAPDSHRLTGDLGNAEPRPRPSHAVEIAKQTLLALELEIDSIFSERAFASPLCVLAAQE
jgi:hypothetical protein